MPVKWTPMNDHILLVKILETHKLSIDYAKISEAWPVDGDAARSTAVAVNKRIIAIRKQAAGKSGIGTHFRAGKAGVQRTALDQVKLELKDENGDDEDIDIKTNLPAPFRKTSQSKTTSIMKTPVRKRKRDVLSDDDEEGLAGLTDLETESDVSFNPSLTTLPTRTTPKRRTAQVASYSLVDAYKSNDWEEEEDDDDDDATVNHWTSRPSSHVHDEDSDFWTQQGHDAAAGRALGRRRRV